MIPRWTRIWPLLLLAGIFSFASVALPHVRGQGTERYDDLAAWAKRDVANAAQFADDMQSAGDDPSKIVVVLQATATRQQKAAEWLVALVRVHPELRNMPELGLDDEGMRQWTKTHRDARARHAKLPAAAVKIGQGMRRSITAKEQQSGTAFTALGKHKDDPEVAAAAQHLFEVLQNCRQYLLRIFS